LNILGLESSTEQGSVALMAHGQILQRSWQGGRGHAEGILREVSTLLEQQSLSLNQLDAIVFDQGPGSFTGVRTACGMAQGLALGCEVPLVAVPSLMAMAEATSAQRVVSVLDARMGQVYLAAYERQESGEWHATIEPCLCDLAKLPPWPGQDWVLAGNGCALLQDLPQGQCNRLLPEVYPQASSLVAIGRRWLALGRTCLPEAAAPLYLRDKVAETVEERLRAR
jgi:tRNA threonylcarbamoyladenosine biosynthesis protein TsaB